MIARLQPAATRGLPDSYLAVGHVVIDVLENGERRPGGTALYSALQAARLGLSATILTRGVPAEIEAAIEPWAPELELIVQPAAATTTLATTGRGVERAQRMLAWAGPVELGVLPAAAILHLAPVAAELEGEPRGAWDFVGITPQGLARGWTRIGAAITPRAAGTELLAATGRCDAIVLSEQERQSCAAFLQSALRGGAIAAVTAGAGDIELLADGIGGVSVTAGPVLDPVDDLGAGDVYAAAFFTSLAGGATPETAARFAHVAAALRLGGVGPGAIANAGEIAAGADAGG